MGAEWPSRGNFKGAASGVNEHDIRERHALGGATLHVTARRGAARRGPARFLPSERLSNRHPPPALHRRYVDGAFMNKTGYADGAAYE